MLLTVKAPCQKSGSPVISSLVEPAPVALKSVLLIQLFRSLADQTSKSRLPDWTRKVASITASVRIGSTPTVSSASAVVTGTCERKAYHCQVPGAISTVPAVGRTALPGPLPGPALKSCAKAAPAPSVVSIATITSKLKNFENLVNIEFFSLPDRCGSSWSVLTYSIMFYAVQNWECQASLPNTALDFNVTAIEIDLLVQLTTNRRQPHGEDYPTCLCNSY